MITKINFDKYKNLLGLVRTVDDTVSYFTQIDLLINNLYSFDRLKIEEILDRLVGEKLAVALKRIWESENIEGNSEKIKNSLLEIKEVLKKLTKVRMTLAFEPSRYQVNEFSNWCRENLDEGIILDINFEKNIIGGAVFVYRGKFYDYSLRTKIEQVFLNDDLVL